MTEHEAPNWPDAPRRLVDVWFSTGPFLYVHLLVYTWAFTLMMEGHHGAASMLSGIDFGALFLTHVFLIMLLDAIAVSQFSCLNVVSRLAGLSLWRKILWWVLVFLVPPLAVPVCYFVHVRRALFKANAPRLGPLPKFVGGFIQVFTDGLVLQFAFMPFMALLHVADAPESVDWAKSWANPFFRVHVIIVVGGVLWATVAGVWFCLRHLFRTRPSRRRAVTWTMLLTLLAPIGIFAYYVAHLRQHVGGAEFVRDLYSGRLLFMRLGRRKHLL